ncbi:uncharacterized protein K02A2.6-like [Topomyia yanbarensis]|uniref:uncharacterized protein K02A2.6-like n=1 Tax=Topomyia yanbarensis TaxID=2498891 RepID=UPI00273B91E0|nr:uncharacterized protein K02A2.6-like [Topomyia yanbarensis]
MAEVNPPADVPAAIVPAAVPTSFKIDPFDRHKMKWSRWVERLEGAFVLFGVQNEVRLYMLLHYMGGETYDIISDKLAPERPQQQTYDAIVRLLEAHFNPEPLEILENFRFKCRKQADDRPEETIDEYLIALRKLAITCNFGDYLRTALRNQFVFGLKDRAIQSRLLEVRNLTLERAREIAVSMELSNKGGREIQSKQGRSEVNLVQHSRVNNANAQVQGPRTIANKKKREKPDSENKGECFRCGSSGHYANKCYHVRTVCNFCKLAGHLEKVCIKKKKNAKQDKQKAKSEANLLEESEADQREVISLDEVCKLEIAAKPSSKFWLDLQVNGTKIRFEVDTGAPVAIISTYDKKMHFAADTLLPSDMQLVSFCDTRIQIEGMLEVKVVHDGKSLLLPLYVSNVKKHPLLGRQWMKAMRVDLNKIAYTDVNKIDTVTNSLQTMPAAVKTLVEKYATLYDNSIGKIKGLSAKLCLKPNTNPVYIKSRPVPFSLRAVVENELDKLVNNGILVKVNHSAWATPIVPVPKANNKVRLCGDYKVTVNPNLVVDGHPLPTIEELFANVAGGEKFTKIDLTQAYLQLEVEEGDREVLTLNTHKGLYQPTRLMYGIASAPAIWQRLMEQVLNGIPGVTVFLDDIRITGPNDQIHLQRLEEVLKRLSSYNMRINLEKCHFFANEIEYCGYLINKTGIHKVKRKITAIQNMPVPENKDQIRSFVGLVNYYGRFFPNLSSTLYPLNSLLKNDVRFVWSKQCEEAFNRVKQEMQSNSFLVHYDPTLPLVLATDASPYGVGAVLSHVYPDGSERPIQYASQTLNATQQAYKQVDREAYGIIFGVRRFYQYLFGRRFTLLTDNEPLKQIFSDTKGLPKMSALRMQHYATFLASFNYKIQFRPTNQHGNADAFSRLPLKEKTPANVIEETDYMEVNMIETLPLTVNELARATAADKTVKVLMQGLQNGKIVDPKERFGVEQHEFTIQKGCIMRGIRVYIPPNLRVKVLAELHSTHFGTSRLKTLARGYVWWERIDLHIEEMVRNCSYCQSTRAEPAKVPTHCWESPSRPFDRIHVDFAGPFKNTYFIVLVDAYTKWPEVRIFNNITTTTTIQVCREYFATYGIPSVMVSDHGVQFTSEEFQKFLKMNGVYHKMGAPYHPSTNGQAERFVQTFKAKLKSLQCDRSTIHAELCNILLVYRKTIHPATGKSPSMMLYNRQIRSRLDLMVPDNVAETKEVVGKVRDLLNGARVAARDYLDKEKWKFGVVSEKLGKLHYYIRLDDGRTWKRHIDQLREVGPTLPNRRDIPVVIKDVPAETVQTDDLDPELTATTSATQKVGATTTMGPKESPSESAGVTEKQIDKVTSGSRTANTSHPNQTDYRQSPRKSGRVIRPPSRLNL